jgi:cyclic beta-1,2-glucan synthetase
MAPTAPYVTRHGFGYSVFEHDEAGIHSELTVFVCGGRGGEVLAPAESAQRQRPARGVCPSPATSNGCLGDLRSKTAAAHPHRSRRRHRRPLRAQPLQQRLRRLDRLLRRRRQPPPGRHADLRPRRVHRAQWHRCGAPLRMRRMHLSGRSGAALDPCAAIQVPLELAPGQSREITFRLGMGRSADEAGRLVTRFRGSSAARDALQAVHAQWQQTARVRCRCARRSRRWTCWPTAG